MVVMAGHQRHHRLTAGQAQRVQELGSAKRLAHDLRLDRRTVVMDDVIGAQQHVAGATRESAGQRAFAHVGQVAQRRLHHHLTRHVANHGRGKNPMADEFGHKARGRAVVQRVGVVPLVQLALVHDANGVTHGKGLELVVGDKQRRGAGRFEDASHLVGQAFAQVDIQVGKRFIEQQQAWLGCQRPGQRHTLLLAAREFMGKAVFLPLQPHQRQHFGHAGLARRAWQLVDAEGHIAANAQVRKQRVVLKHHAHLA